MEDMSFARHAAWYLNNEFTLRKQRRPYYSLRAFARDLSVSPSTLSELLKSKTGLSETRARKVGEIIKLQNEHLEHFVDLMMLKNTKVKSKEELIVAKVNWRLKSLNYNLTTEDYHKIYDWYHFAILELLDLKAKKLNFDLISKRLNIKKSSVIGAFKRLYKLGLIKPANGFFVTTSSKTCVSSEALSEVIQKHHSQILNKAISALKKQNLSQRGFLTTIFSIRKSDISDFKNDMNVMTEELIRKYHVRSGKDLVYSFSQQLFSLEEGLDE